MERGGGLGGMGGSRMAMSYGGGYGDGYRGVGGRRVMDGFGGRGMPTGMGRMNQQQYGLNQQYPNQQYPNQQYSNQQYPNQQYPNQQYPNQQYPNQQYPNQMGGYGGGMMSPGIGFGGTMLLGEGIKRILRHVSFFPLWLTPNNNLLTRSLSTSCISSSSICQQMRKWPKLRGLWIRLSSSLRRCRDRDRDWNWSEGKDLVHEFTTYF